MIFSILFSEKKIKYVTIILWQICHNASYVLQYGPFALNLHLYIYALQCASPLSTLFFAFQNTFKTSAEAYLFIVF